jgi:dihydropyrimidinase
MEKITLIRGGTVVSAAGTARHDLLVRGERIAAVGPLGNIPADETIDASGLLVLPGAVDTHVHFNDVFMNTVSVHDYVSGTRAAAFGGVTSVVDFSNQARDRRLIETLEAKFAEAQGRAFIDWGVHPVITDPTPETLDELPLLVDRGAPTFKIYMTYRGEGLMVGEEDMRRILSRLRTAKGMLLVHAEDNTLVEDGAELFHLSGRTEAIYHARSRPPETENTAIRRAIEAAHHTGGRLFIVHMATAQGLDAVAAARAQGTDVLAETCTHYLVFTEEILKREDGIKWICSPPLREASIQAALWRGLADGRIALVSSDDAAYSWDAKLFGKDRFDLCPNGIPGIEVRLSLLYSEGVAKGRLTLPRFVELIAAAPARIFGLAPRKGVLQTGADADIVLFDPAARWTMSLETLHMATDWSAYEGIEITGRIVRVFSRGETIVADGRFQAEKGRGRFLPRSLSDEDSL